MTTQPDKLEITQEAIWAVETWCREWRNCAGEITALYEVVQRAMTQAAEAAAGRALEAAAKVAEAYVAEHNSWHTPALYLADNIATAIRSLDPSQIAADTGEGR